MTRFRRFSKRRQRAALVVALLDRLEWGEPEVHTAPGFAMQDALCVACGSLITSGVDEIVLATYGPRAQNRKAWIHHVCPSPWEVLARTVEEYDDKIITRINPAGRGRASGCGHEVHGTPIYLVRRPRSLADPGSADWFCERCVTPGEELR